MKYMSISRGLREPYEQFKARVDREIARVQSVGATIEYKCITNKVASIGFTPKNEVEK